MTRPPAYDARQRAPAGVQHLLASCLPDACRHLALIDVSSYPAETEVPSFQRCAKARAKLTHSGRGRGETTTASLGYLDLWVISCRAPRRGPSLPLRHALSRSTVRTKPSATSWIIKTCSRRYRARWRSMRHLIDTYIRADSAKTISDFGEVGLLDLIVKSGIAEAITQLPPGIKGNKDAVVETIAARLSKSTLPIPRFTTRCPLS